MLLCICYILLKIFCWRKIRFIHSISCLLYFTDGVDQNNLLKEDSIHSFDLMLCFIHSILTRVGFDLSFFFHFPRTNSESGNPNSNPNLLSNTVNNQVITIYPFEFSNRISATPPEHTIKWILLPPVLITVQTTLNFIFR